MSRPRKRFALCVALAGVLACSGRDPPPPEVPGVDLGQLTTEELDLYRRALAEEISPCGGAHTLAEELRAGRCRLAPFAARFVAYRIEENDTREEVAQRYLDRYGANQRVSIPEEGAPTLGPPDAPVTLVVFSDFLCPHCARAASVLRQLAEGPDARVRLVFRAFPVHAERMAMVAAIAGRAAERQGRFWELHDAMFAAQRELSQERIMGLAEEIGLDLDRFREDLLDPALEAQVRDDRDLGGRLGVRGTPSLFIDGRRMDEPLSRLETAIEEELARVEVNPRAPRPSMPVGGGRPDAR